MAACHDVPWLPDIVQSDFHFLSLVLACTDKLPMLGPAMLHLKLRVDTVGSFTGGLCRIKRFLG